MSLTHYKLYRSSYFIFLLAYYQQLLPLLLKEKKFGLAMRHVGSQLPNQGSNPCPRHWELGVLTTRQQGKSLTTVL